MYSNTRVFKERRNILEQSTHGCKRSHGVLQQMDEKICLTGWATADENCNVLIHNRRQQQFPDWVCVCFIFNCNAILSLYPPTWSYASGDERTWRCLQPIYTPYICRSGRRMRAQVSITDPGVHTIREKVRPTSSPSCILADTSLLFSDHIYPDGKTVAG